MSDDFFDSNFILYSLDGTSPRKQRIAFDLLEAALHNANVAISYQVVQEWSTEPYAGWSPGSIPANSID